MTIGSAIFLILAVLAAVAVLCRGVLWLEKRFPGMGYDERQKISLGRACRLSFWVGIGYSLVVMILLLGQVEGPKRIEPWLLIFIGILLQLMTDRTYRVMTHSDLTRFQKPQYEIWGYLFMAAVQILAFVKSRYQGALVLTGQGTARWVFLLAGVSFFYLAALHLTALLRDRGSSDG